MIDGRFHLDMAMIASRSAGRDGPPAARAIRRATGRCAPTPLDAVRVNVNRRAVPKNVTLNAVAMPSGEATYSASSGRSSLQYATARHRAHLRSCDLHVIFVYPDMYRIKSFPCKITTVDLDIANGIRTARRRVTTATGQVAGVRGSWGSAFGISERVRRALSKATRPSSNRTHRRWCGSRRTRRRAGLPVFRAPRPHPGRRHRPHGSIARRLAYGRSADNRRAMCPFDHGGPGTPRCRVRARVALRGAAGVQSSPVQVRMPPRESYR